MPVSPNAIPSSGPVSIAALHAEFGKGYNLNAYKGILRYRVSDNYREYTPSGSNAYVSMGDFHGYQNSSPVVPQTQIALNAGSYTLPMFNKLTITIYGGSGGGGGGAVYWAYCNTGAPGDNGGGGGTSSVTKSSTTYVSAGGGGGGSKYDSDPAPYSAPCYPDSVGIRTGGGGGSGNQTHGGQGGGNGGKNQLIWDIAASGWSGVSPHYNEAVTVTIGGGGGGGNGGTASCLGVVASGGRGGDGTAGYATIEWT